MVLARRLIVSGVTIALLGGGALVLDVSSSAAKSSKAQTLKLRALPNVLRYNVTKLSAKAGTVKLVMANTDTSGVPHSVAIRGNGVNRKGGVVSDGGTSTVTAKLKAGVYTYYCTVPGHSAMKGTLRVR